MNCVILKGNCGRDPQIREFENGSKIATFSLAVTERGYKTKDGKEIPDRTDWLNIVARGGLAGICEKYVKKGSAIVVQGKIRNREYEVDGEKRTQTEIHIDELELLGTPDKQENHDSRDKGGMPF